MFLSGTGNRTDLVDFRTHGPAANGEIDIDEINIESMSPEEIKVCPSVINTAASKALTYQESL